MQKAHIDTLVNLVQISTAATYVHKNETKAKIACSVKNDIKGLALTEQEWENVTDKVQNVTILVHVPDVGYVLVGECYSMSEINRMYQSKVRIIGSFIATPRFLVELYNATANVCAE